MKINSSDFNGIFFLLSVWGIGQTHKGYLSTNPTRYVSIVELGHLSESQPSIKSKLSFLGGGETESMYVQS